MTDEEAAKAIENLNEGTEDNHIRADNLLLEILREHGYSKTAEAFEALDKWYS